MTVDYTQISYLAFYFIIYSMAGWLMESIYRSVVERKFVNSGFMYGPYCPIYGFGTLIMILVLQNFKNNVTILFMVSFVVLSFWEYIVAIYLEKVYHTKYWDYSDEKMNIKGRICLENSIYWGILGVVFTLLIHPQIAKHSILIPQNIVFYFDIILISIMIIDFIISSIKTHAISKNIAKLKVLSEKIKEKLTKTNKPIKNVTKNSDEIDVGKLEIEHNKLKIALYKQLTRMKNAFPTMKSEVTSKFLSEKIDISELEEKIKSIKKRLNLIKKKSKEDIEKVKETINKTDENSNKNIKNGG